MVLDGKTVIFIRADARTQTGTGHIMRCIALAQAWQDQGGHVTFLTHCTSESLRQRITAEGFEIVPIGHPHPDPSDLAEVLSIITYRTNRANPTNSTNQTNQTNQTNLTNLTGKPWLVLDGYHFTPDYQQAIRAAGIHLLVIDDMNHLPHYHADILVNQNIHAPDLEYRCDRDTTLLLGTRYVLLRREFLKYKSFKRQIPDKAKNILVTMGGADPDNVTLKVIEAIKLLNDPDLDVKIIIGPSNPNLNIVRASLLPAPCSLLLLQNAKDMPELMAWADMAVSAGGSTCWEMAFMGLPMLTTILAENQRPIGERLAASGSGIGLGDTASITVEHISESVHKVIFDRNLRKSMSERLQELVDGEGCIRVSREMHNDAIQLREVTSEDCRLVWEWANDPSTRAGSFSSQPIPWESHVEWFRGKLADPHTLFYIATNRWGEAFGQIRYHISGAEAVVSVSLTPEARGKGLGSRLIRLTSKYVSAQHNIRVLRAYIKPNNVVSKHAFLNAGFDDEGLITIQNEHAQGFALRLESDTWHVL